MKELKNGHVYQRDSGALLCYPAFHIQNSAQSYTQSASYCI